MILASLVRYYRRLATETDETGNPKVPSYGFSEEKSAGFWCWIKKVV